MARCYNYQESSRRAQEIFDCAASFDLHLALVQLPVEFFGVPWGNAAGGKVTALRSVLMKPEHRDWLEEIWQRLSESTD